MSRRDQRRRIPVAAKSIHKEFQARCARGGVVDHSSLGVKFVRGNGGSAVARSKGVLPLRMTSNAHSAASARRGEMIVGLVGTLRALKPGPPVLRRARSFVPRYNRPAVGRVFALPAAARRSNRPLCCGRCGWVIWTATSSYCWVRRCFCGGRVVQVLASHAAQDGEQPAAGNQHGVQNGGELGIRDAPSPRPGGPIDDARLAAASPHRPLNRGLARPGHDECQQISPRAR